MQKILLIFVTILSFTRDSQASVYPAGKCKDIAVIPFNATEEFQYKEWRNLYVPDTAAFSAVESIAEHVTDISPQRVVKGNYTLKMNDKSVSPYWYTFSYKGGTWEEGEIVGNDGQTERFKYYVLDVTPDEYAVYYYFCTETGSLDIDTRYISIPLGKTMSTKGEQQLLNTDRKYNFTGGMRKLENPYQ